MLGDITVDSHLGEPFQAAIPLTLDADEKVDIEVAAPTDYRNLNIHRDPALHAIRVEVIGNHIELLSLDAIDAPVFTLILKIRDGQAFHFKTYPVFLDPPHSGSPLGQQHPEPVLQPEATEQETAAPAAMPAESEASDVEAPAASVPAHPFKPFDGWARTSHYGPIVRGDILFVVSKRLRIDERYSYEQVMAALFDKNRDRFAENNLNLPREGVYLDVPTAAEVERNTPEQALAIVEDHDRRWKELQKQPRYAAIAKAQRDRYRSH